jgi:hypothetical protein
VVREFRSILDRFYVLCTHFHTFFSGPGPKKKKCPQDRAPWSLGENFPSGPWKIRKNRYTYASWWTGDLLRSQKKKKKKKKIVTCHMSGVRCQVSGVRCQVSLVRRKPALGTVLHGPEEKIFSRDRAPRSRGENLPSGPCSMVPRRKFILGTVLHGPEEKRKNWYNYASRWTRDLWSKGVSLILAYL